jgi:hypothetical protein
MTLAPIDSRDFASSRRQRHVANPAACRLAPLLRLMLLAAFGGMLVFVALGPRGLA